jgi:hypothetical protein
LARKLHRNPPANDEQLFGDIYRVTSAQVDAEIPTLLSPILERLPKYAEPCITFLWELAAVDPSALHSTPGAAMRVLAEAAGYDESTNEVRAAIVEATAKLLARTDLDERLHSPLEILAPVLATSGHQMRSRGESLRMTQYSVNIASVAATRDRAIELCIAALGDPSDGRATRAISILAGLLSGLWTAPIVGENLERLRLEQQRVLDAFDQLARDGNALRRAYLRNELTKYNRRIDELGEHIERTLAALPVDGDMRVLRAAAPELIRNADLRGAQDPVAAMQAHDQALERERGEAVADLLRDYSDPAALADRLNEVVRVLREAGLRVWLGGMFAHLASADLTSAVAFAKAVLADPDPAPSDIRAALAPILSIAYQNGDPSLIELAERDTRPLVRVVAASALLGPLAATEADSPEVEARFASLRALLNDDVPAVRQTAVHAASRFLGTFPQLAVPLIDAVTADDGDVFDGLYMALPRDDEGRFDVPTDAYDMLVGRLEHVAELEYFQLTFLADAFAKNAPAVVALLAKRMARPWTKSYRAIPHDPSLDQFIQAGAAAGATADLVAVAIDAVERSAVHQFDAKEIMRRLYFVAPDETRAALRDSAAGSASPERLVALASIAAAEPEDFGEQDVEFFTSLVERSFEIGAEAGRRVGGSLRSALFTAPRMRQGRETSPLLSRFLEVTNAAIERAEPASEAEVFFEDLRRDVEADIERDRRMDRGTFGPQ